MNRRTLLPAILAASLLAAACDPGDIDRESTDTSAVIDETPATDPEPATVDEPAPTTTDAPTEPAATEPAPPPIEAPATEAPPTTEAAPEPAAAPTFEPLAVINVGSTGGGNFAVTDLAPVLADSQIVGVPIPNAASLIGNRVTFEANPFPAADGGVQHGSNVQFTTQVTTDVAPVDILAAYQVALDGVGAYEYANSEATNETRSQVELAATGDGATGRLPQYIIAVAADSEFPGIAQIDVRRIASGVPGDIPLPVGAAAAELAEPMRIAAENDIPVEQWSYDLSHSQFAVSGTSQFVTSFYRLNLGGGTIDDLPTTIERTQELFGPAVEQEELRNDFFQLKYGDLAAPTIDVKYVESSDNFLEITWRWQRQIDA